MEKKNFKVVLKFNDGSTPDESVGVFSDMGAAGDKAYSVCAHHGILCGQDTLETITTGLASRGYYMLAYGPRELEVVEV